MYPLAHTILFVFAFVCFAFAAWQSSSPVWNRVVSVGCAAAILALLPW